MSAAALRPILLSIAGSDPSGGAGVQGDLKTFAAFGAYGMAAITALTVQNTRGVSKVAPATAALVSAQIDAIFDDIAVDAVKIGMLARASTARTVAASLKRAGAQSIVLDPVLRATRGADLSDAGLPKAILTHLAPLARLITPNLAEAAILTGTPRAQNADDMGAQARALVEAGAKAALIKGGHLDGAPIDVLYAEGVTRVFHGERVETPNTHGTGCALSSAIACLLAQGLNLEAAIEGAKSWLTRALAAGAKMRLGAGAGPPDHLWSGKP
ncbi:bifunctional hydroxymethylpyrimidine kinase/phosphomethylpyrimidine kinase [Methylocystis bryophila]|uniref:hydroxymethylpyrimidine kinase n=1 Tax=Methylocystis bryophila TaxID=655015 RepID=A0A1W6MW94_9HYPH|nr:bifunctional hydroxymethylpyrimidine kinase/phosphomethylpyrimidine kinase [Methylocystis bryophila]ARN81878.1 bifunctional hydroxymethylpyrimidine kinase/phosphomethylpyrimidine kinase [Methylocystis bryophila]BDV37957.1 hydroxymethylpyrimidine/phosphomethylpyrimidine kinase [Methylocystis bryophila]